MINRRGSDKSVEGVDRQKARESVGEGFFDLGCEREKLRDVIDVEVPSNFLGIEPRYKMKSILLMRAC